MTLSPSDSGSSLDEAARAAVPLRKASWHVQQCMSGSCRRSRQSKKTLFTIKKHNVVRFGVSCPAYFSRIKPSDCWLPSAAAYQLQVGLRFPDPLKFVPHSVCYHGHSLAARNSSGGSQWRHAGCRWPLKGRPSPHKADHAGFLDCSSPGNTNTIVVSRCLTGDEQQDSRYRAALHLVVGPCTRTSRLISVSLHAGPQRWLFAG